MSYKGIYTIFLFLLLILTGCSKDNSAETPVTPPEEPQPGQNENIILGENTIKLTEAITDHVAIPVTGMDILLDNSVKGSELPKKGQILVQTTASEMFPSGFLGKVSKVEKTDNGYKIQTEKAYLDEAFERLQIKGEMEIDLSGLTDTRAANIDLSRYESDEYRGYQISYTKDLSANSSITLNFSQGFVIPYTININNKAHKPSASFTLQQKNSISSSFNLSLESEANIEAELFNQPLMTIPLVPSKTVQGEIAAIVLKPQIEVSILGTAKGECTLNSSISFDNYSTMRFTYEEGKTDFSWQAEKQSEPVVTADTECSMNGSIYVGLKCALTARLFSDETVSLSIPFTIGPQISGNLSMEDITSMSYEELSNAHIEYTPLLAEAGVELTIFKDQDEQGLKVGAVTHTSFGKKKEFYLLPAFENAQWNKQISTVTSNVKRDLLVPTWLNYALYDTNGNFIQYLKAESVPYKEEKDFVNPLDASLTIQEGETYYVNPTVELPVLGAIKTFPEIKIDDSDEEVPTDEFNITGLWSLYNYPISPDDADEYPWTSLNFTKNKTFTISIENVLKFRGNYEYNDKNNSITLKYTGGSYEHEELPIYDDNGNLIIDLPVGQDVWQIKIIDESTFQLTSFSSKFGTVLYRKN